MRTNRKRIGGLWILQCTSLMKILLLLPGSFQLGSSNFYEQDGRKLYDYYYNINQNDKGTTPTLLYRFLEQTMSRGCAVSMKCIAGGIPTPTIKWLMDGFEPPNSERFMIGQYVTLNGDVISHFNVTSCSSEDSAEISCSAKNGFGTVSHKSRLNIFGPPFVRDFRKVQNAVSGKDFSIKCPVGGYPIDEINWFKEQKQLPVTSRQSTSLDGILTIKNVQKSDKGNYSCTARYKQMFHSNRVGVNVVVPPKINYFRPQTVVEEGERIVKYCEATGDGPIELEWLKDSDTLRTHDIDSDIFIQHIGFDIALVLVITQVRRHFSNSNFTCIARNEVGEDALTTTLIVQVSPRITKFNFPEVYEGMRVSVHCTVNNYPDQVNFLWLKSNTQIESDGETRILQLDNFSSILSIENVSRIHSSNYTCVVFNIWGNSNHTAELTVLVPPKWKVEPMDIEAVEGETVVSHCEADAYPPPTISWKKSVSLGRLGAYVDISTPTKTSPAQPTNILYFPNGTLLITKVSIQEGKHVTLVCEAENGIGSGLSKLIHLRINDLTNASYVDVMDHRCPWSPEQIKYQQFMKTDQFAPVNIQPGRNTTVRTGSTGALRCGVGGDHPIFVTWYHGQDEIIPLINPRFQIKTVNTSDGVSSELTVTNVQREDDTLPYLCSAKNLCKSTSSLVACKSDEQLIWLLVVEPPETPSNLNLLSKGSRFIQLGWKFTRRRNDDFTRVSIKYKSEGGPWNTIAVTISGDGNSGLKEFNVSEIVKDLRPATTYYFFVIVQNVIGNSESKQLIVKTDEEQPDQTPRNILANPLSATEIKVEWDNLSWSNGEIFGYNIGHRKYSEGGHYYFSTVENPAYETVIRNLNPFTRFEVVIRAFNHMGQGPLSKPYLVTTLESTPLVPSGLNCYTLTSQKIQISWNKLSNEETRGVLKGYKIYIQRADMDFFLKDELHVINTSDTTAVIDNLSKYTSYEIQIVGFTNKGDGELSNSIYCQTEEDVPGPPESIKAIKMNYTTVICWNPPDLLERNGQIIHYNVYVSNEVGRTVPPNITKIEVESRLHPLAVYISASTKIGEGVNGSISLFPDIGIGGGLLSFGKVIHVLTKSDISLSCETAVGNPLRTWFHLSKIIQETERKYTETKGSVLQIKNINQDDGGNYSCFQPGFQWEGINFKPERISYLLIVQSPPPAPKLREHEVEFKSITIRWSIKETSRIFVEGFLIHVKVLDEWVERKLMRRLSSYALHDLSCGTSYPIFLTAFNKAGMSKPSQILNITTKGQRPSLAISPDYLTEANSTWIRVILKDAFKDAGCPIQGFRVLYRKKQNEVHWKSVEGYLGSEKRSTYLVGLEENTNYLIKVLSENEAGTTEITVSVNTLGSLRFTAEPSNDIINSISESLYFNFNFAGPILLISIILIILISGVCLVFKKRIFPGHGEEPTGDSFTYFKQNSQNSQPQQVYMTVKKSTTTTIAKNKEFDLIPNSPEQVFPHAMFELKDRIRNDEAHYSMGPEESNAFYICKHEDHFCNSKSPKSHNEESEEEYESIGSDSDSLPKTRRNCRYTYDTTANSAYSNCYEPTTTKPNNCNNDLIN